VLREENDLFSPRRRIFAAADLAQDSEWWSQCLYVKKIGVTFIDMFQWFMCGPLMMSFAPVCFLRGSNIFGGRLFATMILYRATTNYLVFSLATRKFAEHDEILIDEGSMMTMMNVASGGILLGIAIIVGFARKSHRYQLYSCPWSAKDGYKYVWQTKTLYNRFVDFDEQAVNYFCTVHPIFHHSDVILPWVESLTSDSYIFKHNKEGLSGDEAQLPKTCGDLANFTYAYFFEQIKYRIGFYKGDPGLASAIEHLENLEERLKVERGRPRKSLVEDVGKIQEEQKELKEKKEKNAHQLEKDEEIATLKKELREAKAIIDAFEKCE